MHHFAIHCEKKLTPQTMYDRNGKSEGILTKLLTDILEYICERTFNFR